MSAAPIPAPTTAATGPARVAVARFPNGQAWWESIGQVPLDRVVFDPPPGTATEADLIAMNDHQDRLCELTHGTLVEKTMGATESIIAGRIVFFLNAVVIPQNLGVVTTPDGTIRLIRAQVRVPDVAYFPFARLPGGRFPPGPVPAVVPDLAVEVLSESNTRREMANKLAEYFEAGARLVWYVDPPTRTIAVYTSPGDPVTLTAADRLTAGDVLPGFDVAVADVFDVQ